jgi:outer membrane usher protein
MRPRHNLARDSASGLITALCLFYADQAVAGDDPFAINYNTLSENDAFGMAAPTADNRTANPEYTLFVELRVNGIARARLVQLHDVNGQISIRVQDAQAAGLVNSKRNIGYLPISELKLLKWNFDRTAGVLSVEIARKSDGPNNIDLGKRSLFSTDSHPLTAIIANYDLTAAVNRGGVSVAGLVDARILRGDLSFGSAWRFASNNPADEHPIVRLDTAITVNMPGRTMRATLGDFVTDSPANARAVRLGGFQIGTDFGLRPDLITYPLPDFTGSVAVPTGLDLIVADRRFKAGAVDAGEFTVRNIPVPLGRNSVGVVVRDFLGQERIDTVSFYTSRALLAKSLTQYSINVGAIRRNFGRLSNDYGPWAATARLRSGISNHITVEPSVELAKGFGAVGLSSTFTLGNIGLFTLDARASRFDSESNFAATAIRRRGSLFGASFESIGNFLSLQVEARRASENYDDLASISGDHPPPSIISGSLNFDFQNMGSFRLTAIRQTKQRRAVVPAEPRRSDVFTAGYRKTFKGGINLFVDATHQRSDGRSSSILAGLSVQFGGHARSGYDRRTNAQATGSRQNGQTQANAGLYRMDALPGDIGYAVSAGTGAVDQGSALVAYRGDWGRVEAQAEFVGNAAAARVGASGSLLLAEGKIFAARRLDNGFAIVRTGKVGDIAIQQENRAAGRTNKSGFKLLTEFPAYVPTKISIDPKSLPDMAIARKLSAMVAVPSRSGAMVDLEVEHYQPTLFRLLGQNRQPVAPGTLVQAIPSKSEYVVGFDGMVEVNGWYDDTELRFEGADERRCFASFSAQALKSSANNNGTAPQVHCDGSIRPLAFNK